MCVKCKDSSCNSLHCKAVPVGLRGPRGHDGMQGKQGPIGPQGAQGAQGTKGIQGAQGPSIQGTKGTQGIQGLSGNTGLLGVQGVQGIQGPGGSVIDTGWHDLLGFDFYGTFPKPQARRIGNVIYFRGDVVIPLPDGKGGALTYNYSPGVDSYLAPTTVTPYQGAGGVKLITYGSLIFNWDGSANQSVIPTTVYDPSLYPPTPTIYDGTYQNPAGWKVGRRSVDTGTKSSILTGLFSVVIGDNGQLRLGLPKDSEESIVIGGAEAYYTSPLNYFISNVVANQAVTTFTNPLSNAPLAKIHSNLLSGLQTLQQFFSTTEKYPYSCNAGSEQQVGGFSIRIDGLTTFLNP